MSSFSAGYSSLQIAVDQPLHDILLVENRKLHRDARQIFKEGRWFRGVILPVLVIEVDEDVAVHSV